MHAVGEKQALPPSFTTSATARPSYQLPWLVVFHGAIFACETLVALAVGMYWCPISCKAAAYDAAPGLLVQAATPLPAETAPTQHDPLERRCDEEYEWEHADIRNLSASGHRRALVASDFSADFTRRLTFHRWIEEDVILDRKGFESYLVQAFASAGLKRRLRSDADGTASYHKPLSVTSLEKQLASGAKFSFDPAFAAQAHHMLPGQPWSHGRDTFMRLVRLGLRPNHYFLALGCGPFATGHHVVRYLLTGRYFCIETDEYLLRAAVEFEVPSKGLIHKRPRFLLNDVSDVASLMNPPPFSWLSTPPPFFDFVVVQSGLESKHLERTVTNAARYLRPRSGRMVLAEELSTRLQGSLGLQRSANELEALASSDKDPRAACPFSLLCVMHSYQT